MLRGIALLFILPPPDLQPSHLLSSNRNRIELSSTRCAHRPRRLGRKHYSLNSEPSNRSSARIQDPIRDIIRSSDWPTTKAELLLLRPCASKGTKLSSAVYHHSTPFGRSGQSWRSPPRTGATASSRPVRFAIDMYVIPK